MSKTRVFLVRHGETEWTLSGRHTGRTDIALTENGMREARELARCLAGLRFEAVLSSPMKRALETCRLSGISDEPRVSDDLLEWDYGEYEGMTTKQIRDERPEWNLFRDGTPGGESAEDVGRRADRVIGEFRGLDGDVLVFAHGHVLRVIGARWVGLPPGGASMLALSPASISILGYERETPVISLWNEASARPL